jgi:hypothetical protein
LTLGGRRFTAAHARGAAVGDDGLDALCDRIAVPPD